MRALGGLNGSCLTSINFAYIVSENNDTLDVAIDTLCKGSPNLKTFLVINLSDSCHITDAAVQSIVQYCPLIETLALRKWTDILNISMSNLAPRSCLREIDLSQCYQLTSAGIQGLLKANRKLEVLVLADTDRYADLDEDPDPFIDDALLRCIALHCPDLVKLHLHFDAEAEDTDVTAASFEAMIKGLPALKDFLVEDYNKDSSILSMLGLYCPLLKNLHIDSVDCTDDDIASMCMGCPLIESLHLHHLVSISETFICSLATNYPNLKQLSILCMDEITDDSLCMLFTHCTHLTSVTLTDLCITDKSILTLLRCCPQLRDLTLTANPRLTDYCIQAIPTYCPHMQNLELDMSIVTREAIIQIARYCKQLHTLLIYNGINIGNNTVLEILKLGGHLSKLSIQSNNVNVTVELKAQCDALVAKKRYRALCLSYTKTAVYSS